MRLCMCDAVDVAPAADTKKGSAIQQKENLRHSTQVASRDVSSTHAADVLEHEDGAGPLVVDSGSFMVKAGFAGDDAPLSMLRTIIGRSRSKADKSVYIGYREAMDPSRSGTLKVSRPIQRGQVKNWDDVEALWHAGFDDVLHVSTQGRPVLMTDAPLTPKASRERMAQIMFETFQVPAFYVANEAVTSLYCAGRTTGLVVGAGDGLSYTVPIYEGYALPHASHRLELAGSDLTRHMSKLLNERGYSFTTASERETVRDLKERLAYVATDYDKELAIEPPSKVEKKYELPDGTTITVGMERFICTEPLFKPSMMGADEDTGAGGLQDMCFQSIMSSDVDIRSDLQANIVLAGGSSLFPGLEDRLHKELAALLPPRAHISIDSFMSPGDRKYAAWIGGSILASMSTFQDMLITKAEYDEVGPSIVQRKCF